MNYLDARERSDPQGVATGRFDMTSMNDGLVRPLGYCAGWPYEGWGDDEVKEYVSRVYGEPEPGRPGYEFGQEQHAGFVAQTKAEIARLAIHQAKYHDDGHATADEAFACYRTFLLDNSLVLEGGTFFKAFYKCQAPGCGALTNVKSCISGAWGPVWSLCPEHRNRATVELLWPFIGPSMES